MLLTTSSCCCLCTDVLFFTHEFTTWDANTFFLNPFGSPSFPGEDMEPSINVGSEVSVTKLDGAPFSTLRYNMYSIYFNDDLIDAANDAGITPPSTMEMLTFWDEASTDPIVFKRPQESVDQDGWQAEISFDVDRLENGSEHRSPTILVHDGTYAVKFEWNRDEDDPKLDEVQPPDEYTRLKFLDCPRIDVVTYQSVRPVFRGEETDAPKLTVVLNMDDDSEVGNGYPQHLFNALNPNEIVWDFYGTKVDGWLFGLAAYILKEAASPEFSNATFSYGYVEASPIEDVLIRERNQADQDLGDTTDDYAGFIQVASRGSGTPSLGYTWAYKASEYDKDRTDTDWSDIPLVSVTNLGLIDYPIGEIVSATWEY